MLVTGSQIPTTSTPLVGIVFPINVPEDNPFLSIVTPHPTISKSPFSCCLQLPVLSRYLTWSFAKCLPTLQSNAKKSFRLFYRRDPCFSFFFLTGAVAKCNSCSIYRCLSAVEAHTLCAFPDLIVKCWGRISGGCRTPLPRFIQSPFPSSRCHRPAGNSRCHRHVFRLHSSNLKAHCGAHH